MSVIATVCRPIGETIDLSGGVDAACFLSEYLEGGSVAKGTDFEIVSFEEYLRRVGKHPIAQAYAAVGDA